MIQLKVQSKYFTLKQKLQLLFGIFDGVVLRIPNITLEKNESLIMHSFIGAQTTVAVKSNDDGSLRILFTPPSTEINYIDIDNRELDIESELKERIIGK